MNGAKAGSGEALTVRLQSSTQSVSAFHSLLRTIQAAAREAAQTTPEGAAALAMAHAPQLVMGIAEATPARLVIEFRFADPSPGHSTHPVSPGALAAFMDAFSSFIKSSPIRTLWGGVPARTETTRRPPGGTAQLDERMEQVKAELDRLGDVELAFGNRRIHITRGGVEISP